MPSSPAHPLPGRGVLDAVAASARLLLAARSWRDALPEVLGHLRVAAGASRVYVFEYRSTLDDVLATLTAEDAAEGLPPLASLGPFVEMPLRASGFGAWYDRLAAGGTFRAEASQLTGTQVQMVTTIGVESILLVPIAAAGTVVGAIGFADVESCGCPAEVEHALVTAAALIGTAVERERDHAAVARRDRVLEAVARTGELLLTGISLAEAAQTVVELLGEAAGVSRASVFENVDRDGDVWNQLRALWTAPGHEEVSDDPRLAHVAPAPHWPSWAAELRAGRAFTARTRELPPQEREPLEALGVKTTLAVPITAGGEWWGWIGLENDDEERPWLPAEIEALVTAAALVGTAVHRERTELRLQRRERILDAVTRSARLLLSETTWLDAAPRVLEWVGQAASATRAYAYENVPAPDGGEPWCIRRAEWSLATAGEWDHPSLGHHAPAPHWPRWAEQLARGAAIGGLVREMPAVEREPMEKLGAASYFALPVVAGGEWWGFIGFDDQVERAWSRAETEALRAAAAILGAAIERERADAALREHERTLRAMFEATQDAIFITDDDRRYVDVNEAGCRLLLVDRDELVGRRVEEFSPHPEAVVASWSTFMSRDVVEDEWEVKRADGAILQVETSARPNFLPGFHIAFLRDVTEKRRLEAELADAHRLESVGRLAGGVAHDFNNLLTAITGYTSMLIADRDGDAALNRDLQEIARAAERASDLTRQLLAFGRRQVLKPEPLDLNDVVRAVAPLLDRLLGEDVELVQRRGPALGTVRADRGQLEQVLVNLAVNARDAMRAGGGTLVIETRNVTGAERAVELAVRDTGVGMDAETRSRVFEPFFTTRQNGHGLGLASVHGIVRQSGGDIEVESEPGAGTTFRIVLPRIDVPAVALDPPAPAPAPAPEPRRGAGTILLVEDEEVVRTLAQRLLEAHGYDVIAAPNGAAAVELAATTERRIDLLLTDVVMPGMRGGEVAARVTELRPGIPVLYMSGYADPSFLGEAAAGALVPKPFSADELAHAVAGALAAAAAR